MGQLQKFNTENEDLSALNFHYSFRARIYQLLVFISYLGLTNWSNFHSAGAFYFGDQSFKMYNY